MLLEKAWAKLNGGYGNIISGTVNESFNALTGACTQTFYIDQEKDKLWQVL